MCSSLSHSTLYTVIFSCLACGCSTSVPALECLGYRWRSVFLTYTLHCWIAPKRRRLSWSVLSPHRILKTVSPAAVLLKTWPAVCSPQECFDVVVSRGVGSVSHLMRLTASLLKPGGRLLLRKPLHTPELQEAAALLASGTWEDVQPLPLPQSENGPSPWVLLAVHRSSGHI